MIDSKLVIPAKAGIQNRWHLGFRIKCGMTIFLIEVKNHYKLNIKIRSPRQLFRPYITMQIHDEILCRKISQNQSAPVLERTRIQFYRFAVVLSCPPDMAVCGQPECSQKIRA
jgi:hypothetical protein